MNVLKELPVGISSLENIITKDFLYVDKTKFVSRLVTKGAYYFLSRPRRFGKSLLVDTLKQAFQGNKQIFKGLFLENNWDWDIKYPVIHIDLGQGVVKSKEQLDSILNTILDSYYNEYQIENRYTEMSSRFRYLIDQIKAKCNRQLVILVDEYDKPILDNITDVEVAMQVREVLKNFYSVIKVVDANLQFVLLTGVSKFSKVSLFSGLNNLHDITLRQENADICGYTQNELETNFKEYLNRGNVDKTKLKLWYNGYNFDGEEEQKVYNPFDILLFFSENYKYKNYWFSTGNPEFLIKLIQKNKYYFPNMENVTVMEDSLGTFDVDDMSLTALLFQTGYLTIKKRATIGEMFGYVLSYPNLEVKASLNNQLAILGSTPEAKNAGLNSLTDCLTNNKIDKLADVFSSHFASIPHDWYRNNDIEHYEGFYASIVYSYFCALGYTVIAEDTTNVGKIDLTVKLPDKILILEFKLKKNGDAKSALQQIKDKKYATKYVNLNIPIYLIGMSFDPVTKNVYDIITDLNK
ncbi:MAG: hypothetical protein K0R14_466 [Burkholderiales bacterium]|nr:hypothetical protein [Burkholderiales bacterium]